MSIRSFFETNAPLVFADGRVYELDAIQTRDDLRLAFFHYVSPIRYRILGTVTENDLMSARFSTSPLEEPRWSFHSLMLLCHRAGVEELELRFSGKYSLDREHCFRLHTRYWVAPPPPTTAEIVEAYARRQREDKGGPIIVRGEAVSLDTARAAWATMLRGKVKASDEARAEKERRIVLGPIDDPDHA